jgi:hypothetical protein
MFGIDQLGQIITAVGGLGTAAFGLVDAAKAVVPINKIGFSGIRTATLPLIPTAGGTSNALAPDKIDHTLEANWMNGTDLESQKAIAKSLIKLNLSAGSAEKIAQATGVDHAVLKQIAESITAGTPLTAPQSDLFGRFDLIVTALLDEAYQRSDQEYRNATRILATITAVLLAIVGGCILHDYSKSWVHDLSIAVVVGLLATPLAPIAKDLSSALAAAVNALQAVKK